MQYKTILFDLDGTLTDSEPGIVNSVRYALRSFGMEAEPGDAAVVYRAAAVRLVPGHNGHE